MTLQNLTYDKIKSDAERLEISNDVSYVDTYPEFLAYFQNIDEIEEHHLVIASHFVYGWMPTILKKLDLENVDKVLALLNKVKSEDYLLETDEIKKIKSCVNNSLVGSSKLLHFINPDNYAIWDSRIVRYLTGKTKYSVVRKPALFLDYQKRMREIAGNKDFKKLHEKINKHFKYPISPMRAIEIVMFETDRKTGR
jgi:hypothetical protein